MRLSQILVISFFGLVLAACDVGQNQDRDFIQPGEWEIENGPPGDEALLLKCFTKEDIAKPELGVLSMDNPGCSKDKFSVAHGKIKFSLACALPEESTDGIRMTGEGQYTPTSFEIHIQRAAGGDRVIRGERIGDCGAAEAS
jgi:hypothetical protein